MLEIILDTETTGLLISENHRVVEIGCIELQNQIATKKVFHEYINPERPVSPEAYKVHGYSNDFLSKQKKFSEIAKNFLDFIKDKKIIIHNARFDLSFLDYELQLAKQKKIDKKNVVDTLEIARQKYPGSQNSLDALCKRFNVDNSKRDKHSALLDCELLKEIYINLLDQKEPKLNLNDTEIFDSKNKKELIKVNRNLRKIVQVSSKELEDHKQYIKNSLQKNFFN